MRGVLSRFSESENDGKVLSQRGRDTLLLGAKAAGNNRARGKLHLEQGGVSRAGQDCRKSPAQLPSFTLQGAPKTYTWIPAFQPLDTTYTYYFQLLYLLRYKRSSVTPTETRKAITWLAQQVSMGWEQAFPRQLFIHFS